MGRDVEARPVRVLIADDKPSFRHAAASVVEMAEGFESVGEATNGEEAIALAESLHPDVALIDVNMPGLGGVAAARELRRRQPEVVIVLVSTYDPADLPADVRASGALYLHKGRLDPETLSAMWMAGRATPPQG